MVELIDQYFMRHLELSREDAIKLHQEYYQTYGLAIEGLVRHHKIDAIEYNRQVDDAVPLQDILSPDPQLRKLLEDIDKSKVKLWLFTNAYVNHGKRVVRLLGVDDLFEGMTFCDYAREKIICKPYWEAFEIAMREAGVKDKTECYFVGKFCQLNHNLREGYARGLTIFSDDSTINCQKAHEIGWTTAHLVEEGVTPPAKQASKYQISSLQELRTIFPQFFSSP